MIGLLLLIVCMSIFMVPSVRCAYASEMSLSAGAAKADITPDPAMTDWITKEPYDGVLDPLSVRALILSDGKREVALITWDLVSVTEAAVASLRQLVHEATGIDESHILMAASHSHSTPRSPRVTSQEAEADASQNPIYQNPVYQEWSEKMPGICVEVARQAKDAMRPATFAIGRADVGEWLFNRRPRTPDGAVKTTFTPENPYALPDGLRFGFVDPTMTVLLLRDADGKSIATVFSLPCHAVSIYPSHHGVSGDWPGPTAMHIGEALGGEALFLQGCCGDIVPARRGVEARDEMARFFADRGLAAAERSYALPSGPLMVASDTMSMPLVQSARKRFGKESQPVEIQVIACGPFALVALPGEPLIGLAGAIQSCSPFPHTLVIGYANGRGIGYVGLPGEKARGGYEAGAGRGTDECGLFIVETAARLLRELHKDMGEAKN